MLKFTITTLLIFMLISNSYAKESNKKKLIVGIISTVAGIACIVYSGKKIQREEDITKHKLDNYYYTESFGNYLYIFGISKNMGNVSINSLNLKIMISTSAQELSSTFNIHITDPIKPNTKATWHKFIKCEKDKENATVQIKAYYNYDRKIRKYYEAVKHNRRWRNCGIALTAIGLYYIFDYSDDYKKFKLEPEIKQDYQGLKLAYNF